MGEAHLSLLKELVTIRMLNNSPGPGFTVIGEVDVPKETEELSM